MPHRRRRRAAPSAARAFAWGVLCLLLYLGVTLAAGWATGGAELAAAPLTTARFYQELGALGLAYGALLLLVRRLSARER